MGILSQMEEQHFEEKEALIRQRDDAYRMLDAALAENRDMRGTLEKIATLETGYVFQGPLLAKDRLEMLKPDRKCTCLCHDVNSNSGGCTACGKHES